MDGRRLNGTPWLIAFILGGVSTFGDVASVSAQGLDTPQTWSEAMEALQHDNLGGAAAFFEERVKNRPTGFYVYYLLGATYHAMGDYENALRAHFIAGAYSQVKGPSFYNAARSYAKMNDLEMALRWLDRAIKEGFDDFTRVRDDEDLMGLRDDPRFAQVLNRAMRYRDQGMPTDHAHFQTPWDSTADRVQVRTIGDMVPSGTGGITVDPEGSIFVADFRSRVYKISPQGNRTPFASNIEGPSGNVTDEAGNLIQSHFTGQKVVSLSPTGDESILIDQDLSGPVGVAIDANDNLYIANCNAHTISRLRFDGTHEIFAQSPLFYCPNGIAFDDRGDLYVGNFHDGLIMRVTPDGQSHYVAEIPGYSAGYLAFVDGAFYVTGRAAHRIFKVTREGEVTIVAGTGVRGGDDGPARLASFSRPNGLALSPNKNCLYTNDYRGDWRDGSNADDLPPESAVREIRLDPERGCVDQR